MKVSGRCYAVLGLAYLPPWSVNAGFIAGDHTTLIIDTSGTARSAATIHGYASSVRPRLGAANALVVINTEKHFDHIGGNGFFRELGIDVLGHPQISRTDAEFEGEIEELNEAIPNEMRRSRREAEFFFTGTTIANPNKPVADGATLALGGVTAEIFYTPGHTETNLSVWVPQEGTLYSGDCLISGYLANLDAGGPEDWRVWLESLDRIEKLEPRHVVAGHGPVLSGAAIGEAFATVRRTLEEALEVGHSPTA
jgi:glyoxylase-like metal-dependent hydrolase (beta-lactamase superfamily II)